MGPLCQKIPIPRAAGTVPYLQPCPAGQTDDGQNCIDKLACQWPNACSGSGLPTITLSQRQQCPSNQQDLSEGLCQDICPQGYTGRGDRCFPNCPANFLETRPDKLGSHCVKPTYGRGQGQVPQVSPLQTIKESPNGSTLWSRYPNGTAVNNASQNNPSNLFGSKLGDAPPTSGNTTSDFFSSLIIGIYDMFQNLATFVLGLFGIRNENQWWYGILVIVVVIILLFTAQYWLPLFLSAEGALIKGTIQAVGTAAEGLAEGAGSVIKGVEEGASKVASGFVVGTSEVSKAAEIAQNIAKTPSIVAVPASSSIVNPANVSNIVSPVTPASNVFGNPSAVGASAKDLFALPADTMVSSSNFAIPTLTGGRKIVPQGNVPPGVLQQIATLPKEGKDEVVKALKDAFRLT